MEVGILRLGLVVENKTVVKLKAVAKFSGIHFARLRSYLKAVGLKLGLFLDFSKPTLEIKRVFNWRCGVRLENISCFRTFVFS